MGEGETKRAKPNDFRPEERTGSGTATASHSRSTRKVYGYSANREYVFLNFEREILMLLDRIQNEKFVAHL